MKNIVVLVSGSGSNLQRIIDCINAGEIRNAKVAKVIADRDCYAVQRAINHDIEAVVIPRAKDFGNQLMQAISDDTDLIVLAGFLSILKSDFCEQWQGKIINVHPSLLPKFGGKGMWGHHVHQAVIDTQEIESGATVHYVTFGIDEGEIILQGKVAIDKGETVETLANKIHKVEHEIFPKAIEKVLNG